MKKNVVLSVSIVFGLLLFQAIAMADIQVQSSTAGSYFSLNSNPSSNQGTTVLHLTYNPYTMSTSQSSTLSLNLGSFNLGSPTKHSTDCGTQDGYTVRCDIYDPYTFDLKVAFSIPTGTSSVIAFGDLTGTISREVSQNGGSDGTPHGDPWGDIDIDFNNTPIKFTYTQGGSGEFYLTVNDLNNMTVGDGGSARTITGTISGDTFTPSVAPVPEPVAITLFGTLLLGLGYWKKART